MRRPKILDFTVKSRVFGLFKLLLFPVIFYLIRPNWRRDGVVKLLTRNFIEYESELKTEDKRMVVFTESNKYVLYDLLKRLKAYEISLRKLFPEVDATVLKSLDRNTMELFVNAYSSNFVKKFGKAKTISFIQEQALSKENVLMYLELFEKYMREQLVNAKWTQDWFEIAELKATIDVLAVSNGINMQTADVNNVFTEYCMNEFGRLSSKLDRKSPILINHTMEYMKEHSSKYVLIVMDGMLFETIADIHVPIYRLLQIVR